MKGRDAEHGLEFLLAFDGRIHHLEGGYWLKFEIKRVEATKERPHGLSYSFTLHAPTVSGSSDLTTHMAFRPGVPGSDLCPRRGTIGIGPGAIPAVPMRSRMQRP